jgi:hypothetical protein
LATRPHARIEMKTTPAARRCSAVVLVVLLALVGVAFEKGGKVYSKRNETPLLTEPRPLAAPAGRVGFAEALTIEEVSGAWLRVKAKKVAGWIFSGNVAEEVPKLAPPAGLTTVAASETTTAAAARPLSPAGDAYVDRHGASEAKADVEWLDREAAKVRAPEVETYLRENRKGEYRP